MVGVIESVNKMFHSCFTFNGALLFQIAEHALKMRKSYPAKVLKESSLFMCKIKKNHI